MSSPVVSPLSMSEYRVVSTEPEEAEHAAQDVIIATSPRHEADGADVGLNGTGRSAHWQPNKGCSGWLQLLLGCVALLGWAAAAVLFVTLRASITSEVRSPDTVFPSQPAQFVQSWNASESSQLAVHFSPRVLVLMADSRSLLDAADSEFALSAYINYQYTRLHPNMHFRCYRYQFNHSMLPAAEQTQDPKMGRYCFNSPLGQYRSASWCKLQAIYHAVQTETEVDYILFMDSDAVISNYAQPFDHFLGAVDSLPRDCNASSFAEPSSPCSFLFFDNRPWSNVEPNAGVWMLKRSSLAERVLRSWWNDDNPTMNAKHDFEQSSLRRIFNNTALDEQWGATRAQTMGVIAEPTMMHATQQQYIHHWSHPDSQKRRPTALRVIDRMQHDWRLRSSSNPSSAVLDVLHHIDEHLSVVLATNTDGINGQAVVVPRQEQPV